MPQTRSQIAAASSENEAQALDSRGPESAEAATASQPVTQASNEMTETSIALRSIVEQLVNKVADISIQLSNLTGTQRNANSTTSTQARQEDWLYDQGERSNTQPQSRPQLQSILPAEPQPTLVRSHGTSTMTDHELGDKMNEIAAALEVRDCEIQKKNPNHSGLLRMVTGKPDPSQTDLEVPRPTSSTSFRLSKAAPTCCCQHAALTNCTSTRLTQEV